MKMKISISVLLMFCLALSGSAQVNVMVTIRQPQAFRLKASDMFDAFVTNSGSVKQVYFEGRILNTKTGQKVVSGKSIPFLLASGSSNVSEAMLQPSYNFSGSASQSGELPFGNYDLCLAVYSVADNEALGEGCITVEFTPLSPPLLINPDNESSVYEKYPLLTWLAPAPVDKRISVLYDLKLVELFTNQTPYDAVQRNYSLFEMRDIRHTFLQYPLNASPLEDGKVYAWKVLAKSATGTVIGETEVWTFKKVAQPVDSLNEATEESNFVYMKEEVEMGLVIARRQLKVVIDETVRLEQVRFVIKNEENKDVAVLGEEVSSPGNNQYVIDLTKVPKLKRGQQYVLTASTKYGSKKLLFKYTK